MDVFFRSRHDVSNGKFVSRSFLLAIWVVAICFFVHGQWIVTGAKQPLGDVFKKSVVGSIGSKFGADLYKTSYSGVSGGWKYIKRLWLSTPVLGGPRDAFKNADMYWPNVGRLVIHDFDQTETAGYKELFRSWRICFVRSWKRILGRTLVESAMPEILNGALRCFNNEIYSAYSQTDQEHLRKLHNVIYSSSKPYLAWCWNILPLSKRRTLLKQYSIRTSTWYMQLSDESKIGDMDASTADNQVNIGSHSVTVEDVNLKNRYESSLFCRWYNAVLSASGLDSFELDFQGIGNNDLKKKEYISLQNLFMDICKILKNKHSYQIFVIDSSTQQLFHAVLLTFISRLRDYASEGLISQSLVDRVVLLNTSGKWKNVLSSCLPFVNTWKHFLNYLNSAECKCKNLDDKVISLLKLILNESEIESGFYDCKITYEIELQKSLQAYQQFLVKVSHQVQSGKVNKDIFLCCEKFLSSSFAREIFGDAVGLSSINSVFNELDENIDGENGYFRGNKTDFNFYDNEEFEEENGAIANETKNTKSTSEGSMSSSRNQFSQSFSTDGSEIAVDGISSDDILSNKVEEHENDIAEGQDNITSTDDEIEDINKDDREKHESTDADAVVDEQNDIKKEEIKDAVRNVTESYVDILSLDLSEESDAEKLENLLKYKEAQELLEALKEGSLILDDGMNNNGMLNDETNDRTNNE